MREIIEIVSIVTGVSVENILAQNRNYTIADARKIGMRLMVNYTGLSYPMIGKAFQRHHSSVMNSHKVALDLIATDKKFAKAYFDSEKLLISNGYKLVKRKKAKYKKKKVSKKLKQAA